MNNPSQTEQLLSAILEFSSVSMLLVPFFSPNDNPDAFTTMYRRILESTNNDLIFALLTKVKKLPKICCHGSVFDKLRILGCKTRIVLAVEIHNGFYCPLDRYNYVIECWS